MLGLRWPRSADGIGLGCRIAVGLGRRRWWSRIHRIAYGDLTIHRIKGRTLWIHPIVLVI